MLRRHGSLIGLFTGFILVWELLCRLGGIPAFILPAPSQIALAFWTWREALLLEHLPITLAETLVGLIISIVLGGAMAAAMHLSPVVNRVVYPVIVASQTIPVIALSPLFLFWFGYSFTQKVAVVVLITFFPVAVNTADGLRSADGDLLAWMHASGADRWRILRMVEAPSALPHFFTGLKQAATISVIGAVIGEWLGGQAGLGIFGRRASSSLKTPELFASVIILAIMGVLLFILVAWGERRLMAHRHQDRT